MRSGRGIVSFVVGLIWLGAGFLIGISLWVSLLRVLVFAVALAVLVGAIICASRNDDSLFEVLQAMFFWTGLTAAILLVVVLLIER